MPGGSYQSGGIFNPRPTLYGLLDPQVAPDGATYRWSTAHTTITFPYEAHLGQYADVALRIASARRSGQSPATVTVSLNGIPYPAFTVPDAFEEYRFRLDTRKSPNPYLDPAHIQLDIESTTVVSPSVSLPAPADNSDLGVAVDWIELRPERGTRDVLLVAGAWSAGLLLVLLIALSRLRFPWAMVYCVGAISTFALVTLTYTVRPFPPAYEACLAGLAWIVAAWLAPAKRPAWGLVLLALCLWVVLAGRLLTDWQMDDAYISYRYAWNLTHGAGLVYNPGEAVEGYTNFLWTLIAALFIGAGFHPGGVMLSLVIAFSVGLVGLTYYLGRRLSGNGYIWPLLAVGLLVIDPSFITYGARGSGIEAVPFAFLTLLPVVLLWWRGNGGITPTGCLVASGIVLALASMTRPEGIAVAVILFGVKAWQEKSEKRSVWPMLTAGALPYLLIMVPYQLWRITFYGYLFPNTFYAKTDASASFLARGWAYTWEFVADHWLVVGICATGAVLGLASMLRRARQVEIPPGDSIQETRGKPAAEDRSLWIVRALALLVSFYSSYIIVVGGDHFPAGRFFVPLLSPLILLALFTLYKWVGPLLGLPSHAIPHQRPWMRPVMGLVIGVAIAAYGWTALWLQDSQGPLARRTNRDTNFVNLWGSAGLWLRDHTPVDTLGASPVAGAIAFYGQRNIVDMLGITDEHIGHKQIETMGSGLAGHEKEDPLYVLDRQPDYILPYPDYFTPIQERFDSEYMTTTVRGPLGPDIIWWQRRPTGER
ncbi:MAG TPA: hypothetical protein VJ183_14030 [Chloroflexia bacterium]|nr:hypothetical protein [Chloroflexia bacterium]